jgi:predicted nucleic acid-binding protein
LSNKAIERKKSDAASRLRRLFQRGANGFKTSDYGFKTSDAIHLATAIEREADLFLTGDMELRRCTELAVEVLETP